MKKYFVFPLFVVCFFATLISAQTGETKAWTPTDRSSFISSCMNSAKPMSNDSARFYCYCMQEKIEARYPDVDDAAKISDTDINSPEWQKEIKACLASSWTKSQREEFLSECINTAKESKGQEKAKSYCECMLFKIEKKYPNADDASNITEADLKSESWQKIIKGCLDF